MAHTTSESHSEDLNLKFSPCSNKELTILQINLNHCAAAQDLAIQTASEINASLLIASEPYNSVNLANHITSSDGLAAIITVDRIIKLVKLISSKGLVVVRINNLLVISVYCSPNEPIASLYGTLDAISSAVRTHRLTTAGCIVAGDPNAWSRQCGSKKTNNRGEALEELMAQLDLRSCYKGTDPTFRRPGATGESVVDVTLVSEQVTVKNWRVDSRETLSDHNYIVYQVAMRNRTSLHRRSEDRPRWSTKTLNPVHFKTVFASLSEDKQQQNNVTPENLTKKLQLACDAAMSRTSTTTTKKPAYWWTNEIANIRANCNKMRRKLTRLRAKSFRTATEISADVLTNAKDIYMKSRRTLRNAIKTAKRNCWRKLIKTIEADPWGLPYKIVMGKLTARSSTDIPTDADTLNDIVDDLFPPDTRPPIDWHPRHEPPNEVPIFSTEEIQIAIRRIANGKATGPDGIPNEALKLAYKCDPNVFLSTLNHCLQLGLFPRIWRIARLVLIPKPGSNSISLKLRPLCMLNGMTKLYERLLLNRLTKFLESTHSISTLQFGFRRDLSTIDAINLLKTALSSEHLKGSICVIATVDIKNAFNSAGWNELWQALTDRAIPTYLLNVLRHYLADRSLLISTEDRDVITIPITRGVPQGSVLGPALWNVLIDDLLKLPMRENVKIICFADDILIIASASGLWQARVEIYRALKRVTTWIESKGMKIAPAKSKIMILPGKRRLRSDQLDGYSVLLKDREIGLSNELKYLGVWLDPKMRFVTHLQRAIEKTKKNHRSSHRLNAEPRRTDPTETTTIRHRR